MSVIPTSSLTVQHADDGSPPEKHGEFNDKGFDAAFEKGWSEYESQQAAPSTKKSLDDTISENLDRFYSAQDERESFKASRDSRDELQERYAAHGGSLSRTLDAFLQVAEDFKKDPQGTGLRFAE